jgi:lipoyl(octanoyl) transferase
MRTCTMHWLGRVGYGRVLALQEWLLAERIAGRCGDTILLLEHEPVITLGRGAKSENLLHSAADLQRRGVELFETGRGGDVTMHGPGQLVVYPILSLQPDRCDVRRYVRDLARVMSGLVAAHGVHAELLDEYIGIWANPAEPGRFDRQLPLVKLGAIGVRLSRWATMHGFALNLHSHPGQDNLIVPCGIRGHAVTSLAELLRSTSLPSVEAFARAAEQHVAAVFSSTTRFADAGETASLWQRFASAAETIRTA